MKITLKKGTPILVTTASRGVFFGYYEKAVDNQIEIAKARNCIYWPPANKGFLGLAVDGPKQGARVGPASERLTLFEVTAIVRCSDAAVSAWESAPWA